MTNTFALVASGLLFLAFSAFALWWLCREYKQHGKLTWWNSLAWIGLLAYAAPAYAVTLIEEEHLTRTYGDSYREYCRRVPRYLGLPKRI